MQDLKKLAIRKDGLPAFIEKTKGGEEREREEVQADE